VRLQLILPRVEPGTIEMPSMCPYEGCEGKHFRHHQEVTKPLKDTRYDSVTAHRYVCLRCWLTDKSRRRVSHKRPKRVYSLRFPAQESIQWKTRLVSMIHWLGS
jgi:hypothetical protein